MGKKNSPKLSEKKVNGSGKKENEEKSRKDRKNKKHATSDDSWIDSDEDLMAEDDTDGGGLLHLGNENGTDVYSNQESATSTTANESDSLESNAQDSPETRKKKKMKRQKREEKEIEKFGNAESQSLFLWRFLA